MRMRKYVSHFSPHPSAHEKLSFEWINPSDQNLKIQSWILADFVFYSKGSFPCKPLGTPHKPNRTGRRLHNLPSILPPWLWGTRIVKWFFSKTFHVSWWNRLNSKNTRNKNLRQREWTKLHWSAVFPTGFFPMKTYRVTRQLVIKVVLTSKQGLRFV